MRRRPHTFAAFSTVAASVLLVAGCAGVSSADSDPAPAANAATASPPTPGAPSPSPEPFVAPAMVSTLQSECDMLLDGATRQAFADAGYVFSEDFGDRMVAEGQVLGLFVTYGGIVCQWGVPSTGASFIAGTSSISAGDAASTKARLLAEGYTQTAELGGELFCSENATEGQTSVCFLFEGGQWFTAPRGEIEMVVAQARQVSK